MSRKITLAIATSLVLAPLVAALVRAENTVDIPPVIEPVVTPAPIVPQSLCADLGTCQALLDQVIAELEYWRGLPTPIGLPPVVSPSTTLPSASTLMEASKSVPAIAGHTAPTPPPLPEPSFDPKDLPRLAQVAALVKGMKPREAAAVIAKLDERLAVEVLARVPNRITATLVGHVEPGLASRLLTRLARLETKGEVVDGALSEEEP